MPSGRENLTAQEDDDVDDIRSRNLLHFRRNRKKLSNTNLAKDNHENQGCKAEVTDLHLSAKRLRLDASSTAQSSEGICNPQHVEEVIVEHVVKKLVAVTTKGLHVEKASQMGGAMEDRASDNVHDQLLAVKRLQQNPNAAATVTEGFQANQDEIALGKMPQGAFEDRCNQYILAKDDDAEPGTSVNTRPLNALNLNVEVNMDKLDASSDKMCRVKIYDTWKSGELIGNSFGGMAGLIDNGGLHTEKGFQIQGLEESRNSHDDFVGMERLPADVEGFRHNRHNCSHIAYKKAEEILVDGPCQCLLFDKADGAGSGPSYVPFSKSIRGEVHDDGAEYDGDPGHRLNSSSVQSSSELCLNINADAAGGGIKNVCAEDTPTDRNECCRERDDLPVKKHHLLTSQHTFCDSVITGGEVEGKGGVLLVSNADSCPLVVNGNCTSPSATFGLKHWLKEYSGKSLEEDTNASRMIGHMDLHHVHDEGNLDGIWCNQNNTRHLSNADDNQCCEPEGNKRLIEILESCANANILCQRKQPDATGQTMDISSGDADVNTGPGFIARGDGQGPVECVSSGKEEGEGSVLKCSTVIESDKEREKILAHSNCVGTNLLEKDQQMLSANQSEGDNQNKVSEQLITNSLGMATCAVNYDGRRTFDKENDKPTIAKYSMRPRRSQKQYTCPTIPQLRRKNIPWTSEEEAILKAGVQRFSGSDGKNMPWKEILDYGRSVFQNIRTTVDLKDKWRNICRGKSKPK